MAPGDITIEILKSIRDEIRSTNGRLDGVNAELQSLKSGVHEVKADLHEVKADLHEVKADLHEVKADLREVKATLGIHGQAIVKLIGEVHGLNERFDNFLHGAHREDHEELRARVGSLEAKVG